MTQFYLMRHGDYIRQDTPPYDLGFSSKGKSQAKHLRHRLAKENLEIDILISSPWTRAQQTVKIIAPAVKREIHIEPDIDEWRNNGAGALNGDQLIQQYLTLVED